MDKTQQGSVTFEVKNKLGVVTFAHPAHNSLPSNLLSELVTAIEALGRDERVHAILLKSGGDRTFCAGASFDELLALKEEQTAKQFFMGFANVINAIRKCPKFVIGRVQGKAVGGGVGLAAATDYCFATKYASIKLSELSIGFGPFVIEPTVTRKIGLAATSQMTINAQEWQTAEWAKSKGLFAEVFKDAEQMDAYIEHFTQSLVAYSLEAMQSIKRIFWNNTTHWDTLLAERAATSGRLATSDFTQQALKRFKEKGVYPTLHF